jgi:hypothetical protein
MDMTPEQLILESVNLAHTQMKRVGVICRAFIYDENEFLAGLYGCFEDPFCGGRVIDSESYWLGVACRIAITETPDDVEDGLIDEDPK